MKILMVITGLGVGGAERQVLDLASRFADLGHVVKIAFLVGTADLLPLNKRVHVQSMGGSRSSVGILRSVWNLKKLLREFRPDVVHSHMFHANLITRLLRIFQPIPRLVCTAHSTNEGGKLRMAAYRLTAQLNDVFTNVSVEGVRQFELKKATSPGKMVAVLNGVDVQRFSRNFIIGSEIRLSAVVSQSFVFLAVGRIVPAKDYSNLLKAFSIIISDHPLARLWIVGDGPLRNHVEDEACALGISDHVVFWGIRHDVADLMNAADVFVLASRWEGFGLVVAEAMATERVVVATDCGGVAEVVGDCGFLVPREDSVSLAQGMCDALALTPAQMDALGARARARIVHRFSIENIANTWLNIYNIS